MSTQPLVTGPEMVLIGALVVLAITAICAVLEYRANRRTLAELQQAARAYRPRAADLHVDRAPDDQADYRNTRPRHARTCNLKESTR